MIHVPTCPAEGVAWKARVPRVEGLLFQLQKRVVLREVDVSFALDIQAVYFHLDSFFGRHLRFPGHLLRH